MSNKLLVTLLGLAVLLQLGFAVPVPDNDSKSSEEKKDDLEKFALIEFNKVAEKIVPKHTEILKEVAKDLNADAEKTDADETTIKQIDDFTKNVGNDKVALKRFFEINEIVDPYDEVGKPSKKNPKVHDLLEKHGWRKVRDELDAEIEKTFAELLKKAKEFYNTLSEEEKKKEKSLARWIGLLEDEKNDAGDKLNLIIKFIAQADDSDESK